MNLISTASPLYAQRLVKALIAHRWDGFMARYHGENVRCNGARLKYGNTIVVRTVKGQWILPASEVFHDGFGREIAVSREP